MFTFVVLLQLVFVVTILAFIQQILLIVIAVGLVIWACK